MYSTTLIVIVKALATLQNKMSYTSLHPMSAFVDQVINYLNFLATKIPLEPFAFIGSFIEELVGPIPSPLILMTVGSLISVLNRPWIDIILITALASLGKTVASYLYYVLADKAEDVLIKKFGKFLGVTHEQIESWGKRFSGTWKDDVLVFLSRAIPFFPTTIISLACGFIKQSKSSFIKTSLAGFFVRCGIYIYLGYTGMAKYESVETGTRSLGYYLTITFVCIFVIILLWLYYRSHGDSLKKNFKKLFS